MRRLMQLMQLIIDVLVYPESRLYHDNHTIRSKYLSSIVPHPTLTLRREFMHTWSISLHTSVVLRVGEFQAKGWC
jgi:hypothetical protein